MELRVTSSKYCSANLLIKKCTGSLQSVILTATSRKGFSSSLKCKTL